MYIILPDLHIILFFINFIVKCFKKIFMGCLIFSYIMIYNTTIILNILDKSSNNIELEFDKH